MKYGEGNKLLPNHPLYWMEGEILKLKPLEHAKEHEDMLEHWGKPGEFALLSKYIKPGVKEREYHLRLHLKYWKEKDMNKEVVNKYLEQYGQNDLDNLYLGEY